MLISRSVNRDATEFCAFDLRGLTLSFRTSAHIITRPKAVLIQSQELSSIRIFAGIICRDADSSRKRADRVRTGSIDRQAGLDFGDSLVIFGLIEVRLSHALRRKRSDS